MPISLQNLRHQFIDVAPFFLPKTILSSIGGDFEVSNFTIGISDLVSPQCSKDVNAVYGAFLALGGLNDPEERRPFIPDRWALNSELVKVICY